LFGVRRQPDIDRQYPQLLEHLQDAVLGRDRQREDHQIDAGRTGEFDQVLDRAELGNALAACRAAVVAAIVEYPDDANVGIALRRNRADQCLAAAAGADHDGAAVEAALPRPPAHQQK